MNSKGQEWKQGDESGGKLRQWPWYDDGSDQVVADPIVTQISGEKWMSS